MTSFIIILVVTILSAVTIDKAAYDDADKMTELTKTVIENIFL